MRDKKGPVNKRVDFLSNKLNKYSIKKNLQLEQHLF